MPNVRIIVHKTSLLTCTPLDFRIESVKSIVVQLRCRKNKSLTVTNPPLFSTHNVTDLFKGGKTAW